jgi:hypothetical protein
MHKYETLTPTPQAAQPGLVARVFRCDSACSHLIRPDLLVTFADAGARFYGRAVTASIDVDDPKRPLHTTPTVRVIRYDKD